MTDHRIVGLAEVARRCGVSLSTVNRKVARLRDYGAEKDEDGVWHVPVTAIEGVGWKIRPDTSHDMPGRAVVTGDDTSSDTSELKRLQLELRELEQRLVRAEAEADKWQMIAAERLQNVDDLRRGQRLLEARELGQGGEKVTRDVPRDVTRDIPRDREPTMQDQPLKRFARWRRGQVR